MSHQSTFRDVTDLIPSQGWIQLSVGGGVRSNAANSFIEPVVSQRSNLDVLINTRATKLIQTGTESGQPAFRGIQFAQSATGVYMI